MWEVNSEVNSHDSEVNSEVNSHDSEVNSQETSWKPHGELSKTVSETSETQSNGRVKPPVLK